MGAIIALVDTDSSITEGRGFESHLGLRFSGCVLLWLILYISLIFLYDSIVFLKLNTLLRALEFVWDK